MPLRQHWQKWFYRTTSAEASPIVLDRRRIYILPTRTGLLFVLVLIAMYVGAINYNLGLGHALVFLLAGLGLVGMIHTYRNLAGIAITPGRTDPVFLGEPVVHVLCLHNPNGPDRHAITLVHQDGIANAETLAAGETSPVRLSVPSRRRGIQPLGRLRLRSRYPLGLYEAWSYPYPEMAGLIYPRPTYSALPMPTPSQRPGNLAGDAGDEDFAGFRPRQPGDSLRHVAWKSFARDPDHRPLQVKVFAGGATPELWLDWQHSARADPTDIEGRLSLLCGWVLLADRDGLRYGLRLPGTTIPVDCGLPHRAACLEQLALCMPSDDLR